MRFYSIRSANKREDAPQETREEQAEVIRENDDVAEPLWKKSLRDLRNIVADFNEAHCEDHGVVVPLDASCDTYLVIMRNNEEDPLLLLNELPGSNVATNDAAPSVREITFPKVESALRSAESRETISDDRDVYEMVGLSAFRRNMNCADRVIEKKMTRDDIYRLAEEEHLGKDLIFELDRIYSVAEQTPFRGHPVHYMTIADSADYRQNVAQALISALYETGRVKSIRYTIYRISEDSAPSELETIYKINKGGTVLIRFVDNALFVESQTQSEGCTLQKYLKVVRKYAPDTLTFFNFEELTDSERDAFRDALGSVAVAEFRPDIFVGADALAFVEKLAAQDGFTLDKETADTISLSQAGYLADALVAIYRDWKSRHISTVLYPQYRSCFAYGSVRASKKEARSAYDELMELIGLDGVKKTITNALNYFKLQQEYHLRGLSFVKPNMHMVFTGNPGTAKTTVARLVARIFRENGLLSVGELIEVGRSDIVAQYVGHTAKNVTSIFDRAKGSVLFIDEAYSLVDYHQGSFGDEAINTIVQLMENRRRDTVVIFAGYTKEMDTFLARNPGLRSRIAFHVDFDDYNEEELCDITELIAQKNGSTLSDDARTVLRGIYHDEMQRSDFGNGRFARSIFERAKIRQGERLCGRDLSSLSNAELTTLTAEDFDIERITRASDRKDFHIGFGA